MRCFARLSESETSNWITALMQDLGLTMPVSGDVSFCKYNTPICKTWWKGQIKPFTCVAHLKYYPVQVRAAAASDTLLASKVSSNGIAAPIYLQLLLLNSTAATWPHAMSLFHKAQCASPITNSTCRLFLFGSFYILFWEDLLHPPILITVLINLLIENVSYVKKPRGSKIFRFHSLQAVWGQKATTHKKRLLISVQKPTHRKSLQSCNVTALTLFSFTYQ